jgi:hypothetical protein
MKRAHMLHVNMRRMRRMRPIVSLALLRA